MNTMTTLFGGLAAVVVLYALGGQIKALPPVLRAVLAGVVPLVIYFVLIMGRGAGLDVIAIHISVFLAGALVLYAMTQFRQRGAERMHWAPKLLTGFFIGLVGLNAALLYISTHGLPGPLGGWWLGSKSGTTVNSGFSGVVAHDRDAAKAVSSALSEAHRESLLGWQVEFSGLDSASLTQQIQIRVRDRTGLPVDRLAAELAVKRPGATAAVLSVSLESVEAGVYGGTVVLPSPGRWLLELRLKQNGVEHFHTIQEWVAS